MHQEILKFHQTGSLCWYYVGIPGSRIGWEADPQQKPIEHRDSKKKISTHPYPKKEGEKQ